jgi:drug/metabolite transporter (DMT)-like permease
LTRLDSIAATTKAMARIPSSRIPVLVVTFATNIMMMLGAAALPLGLDTWVAPTGRHLAFLFIAGLFVTLAHGCLLLAYRLGRTAAVAPFYYAFALWAVLSGLLVWHVLPNALALAGITLIAGSGVAIVALDQRRVRIAAGDAQHI